MLITFLLVFASFGTLTYQANEIHELRQELKQYKEADQEYVETGVRFCKNYERSCEVQK